MIHLLISLLMLFKLTKNKIAYVLCNIWIRVCKILQNLKVIWQLIRQFEKKNNDLRVVEFYLFDDD